MLPDEVPQEWVDDAVDVWHDLHGRVLLDDVMRSVIAVALAKAAKVRTGHE